MLDALDSPHRSPRARWLALAGAALAVALIAVAGVVLALRVVESERARDLRAWQIRLGLVAEARAAAIADWVERHRDAVRGLAENPTLQLFLTELALAGGDRRRVTDEPAQAAYVRNLLVVTAERAGFAALRTPPAVAANVARTGGAGLAALDAELRPAVATLDFAVSGGAALVAVEAARASATPAFDLATVGGARFFVAAAPVAAIQAEYGAPAVGIVLGLAEVEGTLWPLLRRPPAPERSAESLLVRRAGAALEFLSPRADAPSSATIAADTQGLAEAWAAANQGGFALLRDLREVEVLVTARAVAGTDWVLVHRVDRAEALADSDARLGRLLLTLCLGTFVLALLLVAVWRHGASRRMRASAHRLAVLARRFQSQGRLLQLVTDNQRASIFIADAEGRVRFANRRLAERAGAPAADLVGKRLAAVLGPAEARRYEAPAHAALAQALTQTVVERSETAGVLRVTRAEHVPLPANDTGAAGVLVVEEDITAAVAEREKRERTLRALVEALVRVVDRRDPFASNHSERVAAVAGAIAAAMDLDPVAVETAEIAGRLMNLGKALVPEALLTRHGALSEDERREVRHAMQAGVEMLAGIEFNGPVVETLRRAQERWDGIGPHGLAGEAIPVTARVIAVANAFVAMVSARAHRAGLDVDRALAALQEDSGKAFDRRAVAALGHVLENRGGRQRFAASGN